MYEADKRTDSGIPVKEIHTRAEVNRKMKDSGSRPGEYPFERGIYPKMYRERQWSIREYAGFGDALETNRRFKFLISHGITGLSVAFDLPTQLGYDSDNLRASGEVGRVGVAISSLRDMDNLFDGIFLEKVSTSMTINSTASILLAMYAALAKMRGIDPRSIRGTTQNDILKEFAARNTFIFPPAPSLKLAVDLIEYCAKKHPKWHPISISGYHIREAGANAIQEIAFTLSNAIEYVNACLERGMKVDSFASRLSFFFAVKNDFFEEVAKFRAARKIWARIMKEKFKAKRPESMKLRFHTQTSGETLTAKQPENNVVRVAIQALAAVLGGTQSLHTNSRDEALSLPTEEAAKIALRTQQIIAHETGVTRTADPLGGSYYLEYLTTEIEDSVWEEISKIENMGGALRSIESGYMMKEIRESAYRYQREIDSEERVVVGVNRYVERTSNFRIHRLDPRIERKQIASLKALKENRNDPAVEVSLSRLEKATVKGINLLPFISRCLEVYATLGEITDVLRGIYGEYRPQSLF